MSDQPYFDLKSYRDKFAKELSARLSDSASFVRSVDMAINSYSPQNNQDQPILSHPPLRPFPEDLTELSPNSLKTAARLAILDMIGATEDALRQCWLPLRTVNSLIKKYGFVSYPEWEDTTLKEYSKIRELTFGQVVRGIMNQTRQVAPDMIPENWIEETKLLKYVKFRNCIAHRLGYVNEKDIGQLSDSLEIEWRDIDFYINDVLYKRLPKHIEDVKTVEIHKLTRKKRWNLGDRIDIEPEDAVAISLDLFLRFMNFTSMIMAVTAKIGNQANIEEQQ